MLIAALATLLATLLAALPWGLAAESRLVLPLLPFAVLHVFVLRDPARAPEWLAFVAGLTFDVLSDGPVGYWPLIYLLGYALTVALRELGGMGFLGGWALFAGALLVMSLAETLLASLYFAAAADWQTPLVAAGWATLLYPVIALPLSPFARSRRGDEGATLPREA